MAEKSGAQLIAEERQRQIDVEGWTAEHDDQHKEGEMARAAAAYALVDFHGVETTDVSVLWPWSWEWLKPSNRIRNLVKAGALLAAEIDRLLRLENGGGS